MAQQFLMQAKDSQTGALVTWVSAVSPDFAANNYPGPGSPIDIVVTGTNGAPQSIPPLQHVLLQGNDADGHQITNLGAPQDPNDAARLADVGTTQDLESVLGEGNSAANQKITDLGAPEDPNDAARKADVDAIQAGPALSDDPPEPIALVASEGTSDEAARADHVHTANADNVEFSPGASWLISANAGAAIREVAGALSINHLTATAQSWTTGNQAANATIHVARVGRLVALSLQLTASGSTGNQVNSTIAYLPTWARPALTQYSWGSFNLTDDTAFIMEVQGGGQIRAFKIEFSSGIQSENWTNGESRVFSICYVSAS